MNSHLMSGFADELVKHAKPNPVVTQMLRRIAKTKLGKTKRGQKYMGMVARTHGKVRRAAKDPELRRRVKASTALGAATGAASGVAGGGDEPALKRALRGAAGGAAGGAITGAAFPGWFAKSNRKL